MPIAKSSSPETLSPSVGIPEAPPTGLASYEWQGIPIDMFRHFGVELGTVPTKDIAQLKDIVEWAKSKNADEPSIGNVLQTIAKVQRELGTPALNEKAYSKVWQFVKLQKTIDDMTSRQNALRGSRWL